MTAPGTGRAREFRVEIHVDRAGDVTAPVLLAARRTGERPPDVDEDQVTVGLAGDGEGVR